MKKNYRLIIGQALLCPLFTAFAEPTRSTTQAEADDHMGNLDKSHVRSGFLYNRARVKITDGHFDINSRTL